jgi:hypothetical protein
MEIIWNLLNSVYYILLQYTDHVAILWFQSYASKLTWQMSHFLFPCSYLKGNFAKKIVFYMLNDFHLSKTYVIKQKHEKWFFWQIKGHNSRNKKVVKFKVELWNTPIYQLTIYINTNVALLSIYHLDKYQRNLTVNQIYADAIFGDLNVKNIFTSHINKKIIDIINFFIFIHFHYMKMHRL